MEKIKGKERLAQLKNSPGFIINLNPSESLIHSTDCYFIQYMKPEKKEGGVYYAKNIAEIITSFNGKRFYKCFYCDPAIDKTKLGKNSITIQKKEHKGLPPWNLAMPPAWEYHYSKQYGKMIKNGKIKGSTGSPEKKEKGFFISLFYFFIGLLVILFNKTKRKEVPNKGRPNTKKPKNQ